MEAKMMTQILIVDGPKFPSPVLLLLSFTLSIETDELV